MSRLTASPFHKPSPFEFPRTLPVSPPETNSDSAGPSAPTHEATVSVAGGIEALHSESDFHHNGADSLGSRLRRGPSLHYQSSGIREAKERIVQRSLKSFIIVVPPSILLQEHGQLGHTLSLGPRHRLEQGMLMPLFPTMYGQLTAIAREYNFPSTAGLCLYFHYSENGVTATPRISDDSWQMVWGSFLDATNLSQRPPICGKIEFDIDLRFARWYHAWISSSHRDHVDVPTSVVPSTAPSIAHFRTDSRNTDIDLNPHDDHGEVSSVAPQSTARHIPKKLSLVDRLDTFSNRSFSRPPSRDRSGLSPPEQTIPSQVLSPIFQEDEPKTAKQDLEKRVNNWRVSASLTATSLAFKQGQVSLEPANIPNSVSLDDVPDYEDGELNLEDFTWSVSSQGPGDFDEALSVLSWDRTPSVHLAGRLQGSVCMTPSTVTSFGPSDYTLPSPIPSSERAYTPDLGFRLYEDVPLTPTTATSWGPPSEYPPSPYTNRSMSSFGLAHRLTFSRPTTPTTATSWGPSSWPASPVESMNGVAISVHLGDRGSFSRPVTPSTATSWGAPLSYPPSPASPFYVRSPDIGERTFEEGALEQLPWAHGWPYQGRQESPRTSAEPWAQGWPYCEYVQDHVQPWNHCWPYHSAARGPSYTHQSSGVESVPWSHNWPYHAFNSTDQSLGAIDAGLTHSRLGYPDNLYQIYPAVSRHVIGKTERVQKHVVVRLEPSYPSFDLYPAVYPGNLAAIYPQSLKGSPSRLLKIQRTVDVRVVPSYPVFQIYRAVYPWNLEEIYPSSVIQDDDVKNDQGYPLFNLYPAVYPHFDLYPSVGCSSALANNLFVAGPAVKPSISVDVEVRYPIMVIYRPVYPFTSPDANLPKDIGTPSGGHTTVEGHVNWKAEIALCEYIYPDIIVYPPVSNVVGSDRSFETALVGLRHANYPFFDFYPATYPHFDIYPSISGQMDVKHVVLEVNVNYPVFDLYPSTYPHCDIYPPISGQMDVKYVVLEVDVKYPVFDLYPAMYPYINVYPPVSGRMDSVPDVRKNFVRLNYPVFDLYPAVYPHFNLYPPIPGLLVEKYEVNVRLSARYPAFELYAPVYPHFSLWPTIQPLMQDRFVSQTRNAPSQLQRLVLSEASRMKKSHADLHHEVLKMVQATGKVKRSKTHLELHEEVFPHSTYVSTPSGTPVPTIQILGIQGESQSAVPQPTRLRSSSISRRPVNIAPPPAKGLPPHPGSHHSSVTELAASPRNPSPSSRVSSINPQLRSFSSAVQPLRRSASSVTSSSRAHVSHNTSDLPSVDERSAITPLSRSSSLSDASRLLNRTRSSATVTSNVSPKPSPRKRDSLVLQRVRAINASSEDDDTSSVLSLTSRFPMPPRPSLPSRPPV
ncbi:hypothetical protein L218DRAFT_963585 [Marasmius fiardii PR-910]|nr:hypothetical protein L218DRAFT_963585 [Marasmius fiardii PR-910]